MFLEMDAIFWDLKVPHIGILKNKHPNCILHEAHQTKMPDVTGWNKTGFNAFIQKYSLTMFDSFQCPQGVNLFLFSKGQGLPSPAALLFNQPITGIMLIIFRLLVYSDNNDEHSISVYFSGSVRRWWTIS